MGGGAEVVVLDNLSTGKKENLLPARKGPGRLTFIEDDIRDLAACRRAMAGVDYVLHQAARASVQRSIEDPVLTNEVNVTGGLNVLDAARREGVKRVVAASSSSVYGDREDPAAPKREDMDPAPHEPLCGQQGRGEYYARAFHRAYGLPTVCLRYFNVFGARQDPESPYAAVIPKFLFALMANQAPRVFGDGRQEGTSPTSRTWWGQTGRLPGARWPGAGLQRGRRRLPRPPGAPGHPGRLLGVEPRPEFAPARTGDVRFSPGRPDRQPGGPGLPGDVGFEQGLAPLVEMARQGRYLAA